MGASVETEADILQRVIEPGAEGLSTEAARAILNWRFPDGDHARMRELSEKASEGTLTADERKALDTYLLIGHLLAIAHSRARQALKRHQPAA